MTDRIETVNKKAPADRIAAAIVDASDRHRIDPLLVLSVIETREPLRTAGGRTRGRTRVDADTESSAEGAGASLGRRRCTIERNI